jgi:hypothetical protein
METFNSSVDELLFLFKKYKINIDNVLIGADTVHVERYGVTIPYSQKDLCTNPPKQVVRDIIMKVIQHPEYKAKTMVYVQNLAKRPVILETKKDVVLTIDDKKKLIREKLVKEGII